MTPRRILYRLFQWSIAPLSVALISVATIQPATQAQPPAAGGDAGGVEQPGTQVLTRGPIHEAFGQPTVFNPKPGLQIAKKPPQPVEELPPDEKPEGDNVSWLGGYWSWDEEKGDFMWVSGFWRVLPPGRQWIPGYWAENAGQYQWVGGYWGAAAQEQQEVIKEPPPESLEQGAPPTSPSTEHIWAPGCWVYRDYRYMWRPGYWIVNQPGWAWVPACYSWTPCGYVYVDGYWDWSIRRRGVLFAPCYFDPVVCYRPGFYYRPAVCLDIDIITPHFFCRPAYCHYYFGDYYATSYLSIGITPWFNIGVGRTHRFYSCDFAYYECHYRRSNPNWAITCRLDYERCRDNVVYRPARTYVNQVTIINNVTVNKTTNVNVNNMALGKPMKTYTANLAKNPDAPIKFEKINDNRVRDLAKNANQTRQFAMERSKVEKLNVTSGVGAAGKTGTSGNTLSTTKLTLPKSTIVSKVNSNTTVDAAGGTKSTNISGINNQLTRVPPPLPGGSVTKSTGGTTGAGTTGGATGTGAGNMNNIKGVTGSGTSGTGSGTAGSTGTTKGTTGSGTTGSTGTKGIGSGSTGSGSTGSSKGGSGVSGGSTSGSKGSSSSGSGSGSTKSGGSSSSGSGSSKGKDKDK